MRILDGPLQSLVDHGNHDVDDDCVSFVVDVVEFSSVGMAFAATVTLVEIVVLHRFASTNRA